MPSLRKRVSSYFRQLSFHNETRDKRSNVNENSFVTKYLQGHITLKEGPPIIYGKNPTDLPSYDLAQYETGCNTIVGCYSGPNGGLTTVKRIEKHLSVLDPDIDFIDTQEDSADEACDNQDIPSVNLDDTLLPNEWNKKNDKVFGISDSLYDRNQVTKNKNGDPIADCFGIIARNDSAILAVADGVNWGEKASIAAKSAVHGCLHYLNKTIFNDTKPFENLTTKTDDTAPTLETSFNQNLISNTREVFVCLLRAFNCAHDLILENKGMLTTLTVAVVLPLKQKTLRKVADNPAQNSGQKHVTINAPEQNKNPETRYICCVCNVGDTLAYVYSQKHGVRELTKGSHDINCNRDMRDALGALGPVDGINPELSNLTLSITTLQKGDIVMVASDGLTDNFDPNVCRFTVNSNLAEQVKAKRQATPPTTSVPVTTKPQNVTTKNVMTEPAKSHNPQKPPIKPPRRSKAKDDSSSRSSAERMSLKSTDVSEKSTSPSVENVDVSTSTVDCSSSKDPTNDVGSSSNKPPSESDGSSNKPNVEYDNPLIAQFMRENSVDDSPKKVNTTSKIETSNPLPSKKPVENKTSSLRKQSSSSHNVHQTKSSRKNTNASTQKLSTPQHKKEEFTTGYKFLRSKTSLDFRSASVKHVLRNEDGIPYVTPIQRYELQLLLMEDVLKNGISGRESPCTFAKKLCENLVSFTISITNAKRHTLEDQDLYFDNRNGVLVEVSQQEKKMRRKRGLERVQNLPGKLDHVTVVAYNVGNFGG